MPTASVPQSLRDALGPQAADDLADWFDASIRTQAVPRDEFREVLSRLDVIETEIATRFEQVDQRFEQVDQRFEQVDQRFDKVDRRFEHMSDQLDRMNGRILSMTRWLIGLLVVFGTMVTVLLAVAQFTAT